ncbi:ABC transporter substrate-binding protein [Bradyrhizobium guangxiense]
MAASPIYQRGGLVQFGFTNSHPDFTKGGDFMWSTSVSQADEQPLLAAYAVKRLGLKKLAVLHLNTDWGRTSRDYFVKAAKEYGAEIAVTEGYIAEERDFRSTLVRVRDANPDGLILISYYSDGALIARQARQVGLKQVMCAASSVYSPKFIEPRRRGGRGRSRRHALLPRGYAPRGAEVHRWLQEEIQWAGAGRLQCLFL